MMYAILNSIHTHCSNRQLFIFLAAILLTGCHPITTISGFVLDTQGRPVEGATVLIQGSKLSVLTDSQGRFILTGLVPNEPTTLSAWKELYYCAKQANVKPSIRTVRMVLRLYQTNDNPQYSWMSPTGENSCYSCKPAVTQIWLENDAHGKSAINPRFLTMYNGTNLQGQHSPITRYAHGDYGKIPLPPDPSKPYYGPGYKLDFQNSAGNCANCHIPGAAVDDPNNIDPNQVQGVNLYGIHCDFCHKVAGVRLDPTTNMPNMNQPGVLSLDIRRPFPQDKDRYQLFFGTFMDDNVPEEDTALPLISQSQFCAPCHYGTFWDTVVYDSYGEWLRSSYSDPATGKTCQSCHMPSPTVMNGTPVSNVAPGKGGVNRDPLTIHAHTFPGSTNQQLLQNALSMQVTTGHQGDRLLVSVTLTNDKTGHAVPTDSPLRHLILLVQAIDQNGNVLSLLEGEKIPEWGGEGDPILGYYAGQPGKIYAKVLIELWTGIFPSGAYWNQTRILSDNRLMPFQSDNSQFVFSVPASGEQSVSVRLLYRRAYRSLADQKGWNDADILMNSFETIVH